MEYFSSRDSDNKLGKAITSQLGKFPPLIRLIASSVPLRVAELFPVSQQAPEQHLDSVWAEWIRLLISLIRNTCVYPGNSCQKSCCEKKRKKRSHSKEKWWKWIQGAVRLETMRVHAELDVSRASRKQGNKRCREWSGAACEWFVTAWWRDTAEDVIWGSRESSTDTHSCLFGFHHPRNPKP